MRRQNIDIACYRQRRCRNHDRGRKGLDRKQHQRRAGVAEKTGLERTHLYRKLRQLGVDLGRGKRN